MNCRRFIALTPNPMINRSIAGQGCASQQKWPAHVRLDSGVPHAVCRAGKSEDAGLHCARFQSARDRTLLPIREDRSTLPIENHRSSTAARVFYPCIFFSRI
jgi:phosphoribosylcarboxyaminoimidazole (NCAIR) mutase